jgi:hypothetical protein
MRINEGKAFSLRYKSAIAALFTLSAGLLTLACTWLGLVGLWIFGGRLYSIQDIIFIVYPLLAFPIFLLVFVSRRAMAILLTLYFAANWIYDMLRSLPRITIDPVPSMASWLLLTAVLLADAAWILETRRHRGEN